MKKCVFQLLLVATVLNLGACVSLRDMADSLSYSMSSQSDLEIVRSGVPAYMIMIDSMIDSSPDDSSVLLAGSRLYSAYVTAFVDDPERAKSLSSKAWQYAVRAFCEKAEQAMCAALDKPLDAYQAELAHFDMEDSAAYLYGLASAWAGWIQTHSADWSAIADLPKVEASMRKIIAMDDHYDNGNAHVYLGVLNAQLPASLGGKPEVGKEHFEKAIEISKSHNLMAKVLYARYYARLVFDKELHDRLLQEVVQSAEDAPAFRLANALAKKQAKTLLAGSDEYF